MTNDNESRIKSAEFQIMLVVCRVDVVEMWRSKTVYLLSLSSILTRVRAPFR